MGKILYEHIFPLILVFTNNGRYYYLALFSNISTSSFCGYAGRSSMWKFLFLSYPQRFHKRKLYRNVYHSHTSIPILCEFQDFTKKNISAKKVFPNSLQKIGFSLFFHFISLQYVKFNNTRFRYIIILFG